MSDYVIRQVKIIDGSGQEARVGDVGVISGRLHLSDLPDSLPALDGRGLTLTPGFIDSHAHSDLCIGADPKVAFRGKMTQGVTTEVCGQCGISLFPVTEARVQSVRDCVGALMSPRNIGRLSAFSSFDGFVAETAGDPKYANCAFLGAYSAVGSGFIIQQSGLKPQ